MSRAHTLDRSRHLLIALAATIGGCASSSSPENANNLTDQVTAAQCAAAKPWSAWTPYATGTVVTYGGTTYQCVQGHTSQPDWTPPAVRALWEPVTCAGGSSSSSSSGATST